MDEQSTKNAPFLEWGREESIFEDKGAGQKATSNRRFIVGNWFGKFVIATAIVAAVSGLALLPNQGLRLLTILLGGHFF